MPDDAATRKPNTREALTNEYDTTKTGVLTAGPTDRDLDDAVRLALRGLLQLPAA